MNALSAYKLFSSSRNYDAIQNDITMLNRETKIKEEIFSKEICEYMKSLFLSPLYKNKYLKDFKMHPEYQIAQLYALKKLEEICNNKNSVVFATEHYDGDVDWESNFYPDSKLNFSEDINEFINEVADDQIYESSISDLLEIRIDTDITDKNTGIYLTDYELEANDGYVYYEYFIKDEYREVIIAYIDFLSRIKKDILIAIETFKEEKNKEN